LKHIKGVKHKKNPGLRYAHIVRLITALAFVFILILLSACGEQKGVNNGAEDVEKGINEKDLVFTIGEKEFLLNSDVKLLLDALGRDYVLSEAPSCLYEGNDKAFEYEGIAIYTYPVDGKDLIDEIVLIGEQYKTGRGISVGSTIEELTSAYGEDYIEEGNMITYRLNPDDMKSPCLYFIINDGTVESISYYSASNL
jgi:hypothetical protein